MNPSPSRVMGILPSFAGGGAERVALMLLGHLDTAAFETTLTVLDGRGPLQDMVPDGMDLIDLKTPRLRTAMAALIKTVRRVRPDVVFSTLGYVNLALLAARPFLPRDTRIIVREANMPSAALSRTRYPAIYKIAYRLLYRTADAVICSSEQMRDEFERDYRISPRHLTVMPNPVDEELIRAQAVPPERSGCPGVFLIAAGRLTRQKGFDRLLEMMTGLQKDVYLTILGEGPDRPALEKKIDELGLSNRVRLPGFVDNPWPLYAGADAFVMTSRWEGLPNVALEALACGTSVLATPESGGIAEIAASAIPGAVSIRSIGADFVEAISNLRPQRQDTEALPGKSLLPSKYRLSRVVKSFEYLLLQK